MKELRINENQINILDKFVNKGKLEYFQEMQHVYQEQIDVLNVKFDYRLSEDINKYESKKIFTTDEYGKQKIFCDNFYYAHLIEKNNNDEIKIISVFAAVHNIDKNKISIHRILCFYYAQTENSESH